MKRMSLIGACALLFACGRNGSNTTGSGNPEAQTLHPQAIAQIEALIAEKEARTPAQRKIGSQLLYAKYGFPAAIDQKQQLTPLYDTDETGRWLVDVKGEVGPALEAMIKDAGGVVLGSAGNTIRARVPLDAIEQLAAAAEVHRIVPALSATTRRHDAPYGGAKFRVASRKQQIAAVQSAARQSILAPRAALDTAGGSLNVGAVTSQGSKAQGADRARKFYGTDGTGVKVGVLSDSDDFKEQSIATGDLPADTVTVPGQSGRPGSGEGTAMMQIVHDMAPGAKLFFATAFTSPESFADNIRTLRFTYGCDIILDDVIYYFENPWQDDIIAQAVSDVIDDGAMYFSSAGNEGSSQDGTSAVWEGDFNDSGTLSTLAGGYTVHDFGGGAISNRIEVGGGPLILHWSDRATLADPHAVNDYDLFVLSPDLRSVAVAATDIQDGDDLAFEFLGYLIPADYRVVVAKKAGAQVRAIRTQLFGGEFAITTNGSTYGHATTREAFGVAAVDVAMAAGGEFTEGPTTQVELFSSDGYRHVFYDKFGNLIDGGGPTFAQGGGETRVTPNIAAADGVSTTLPSSSGLNPFFGTSAAAPHAGGVAALILGALPGKPNWYVTTVMAASATDIEQSGGDTLSGSGVVNAFDALAFAGAPAAVFLELGTVTATPTSGSAIVPGGSATMTVQLFNNGGARARNVNAALSTTTPGVIITTGSSPYANIDAGANGTNATPFAFSLSSSAPCGLRVDFTLTVSFSGRGTNPTVLTFSVQTGVTSSTPSAFSFTGPPAPIPDNNAAGVNVPIPVSGVGTVSAVTFSIDGTACTTAIGASTVGLDHSWVGDLIGKLTSPSGTTVTLFSRPGGTGNSGNNFCQTVFSDAATSSIQAIAVSGAPWTGTFQPAQPLSGFAGESGNGTWVLNVSDNAAIDVGSVRAVTLRLSGFSCGP